MLARLGPCETIVLSYVQVEPLLAARQAGATRAILSPDLGLTTVEITIEDTGARFPTGEELRWDEATRITRARNQCFALSTAGAREIAIFSARTHWVRSLMPTASAPTMLVSGIPMHRIKDTDPWRHSQAKIRALAPIWGRVLDTATGLGYTAILAAQTASEVVTIELDSAALEVARLNPWSRPLFTRQNIRQVVADAAEVLPTLAEAAFTAILHDPPTQSLGGELYSLEFYRQLYRVLRQGGRLFHYIGDPESASGRRVTPGVLRRLREAGFAHVARRPEAFGVLAYK